MPTSPLLELPHIPLHIIIWNLPAPALAQLSATCKTLRELCTHERFWKRLCLKDWPWFFWTGTCEYWDGAVDGLEAADVRPNWDGLHEDEVGRHRTKKCLGVHVPTRNPYHQLPESFHQAYIKIALGRYTGILQAINSLTNRQMSAFTGLGTYDYQTSEMVISYRPGVISRYRRGDMILLRQRRQSDEYWDMHEDAVTGLRNAAESGEDYSNRMRYRYKPHYVDESFALPQERSRLRRIPETLLKYDPREIYFNDLYAKNGADGKWPAFKPGDDVEVQWRSGIDGEWAWWKGNVAHVNVHRQSDDYDSEDLDGDGAEDDDLEDGIMVLFPHYPPTSAWFSVTVPFSGSHGDNPRESGELGQVGGVRHLGCIIHKRLWEKNFQFVNVLGAQLGDEMEMDDDGPIIQVHVDDGPNGQGIQGPQELSQLVASALNAFFASGNQADLDVFIDQAATDMTVQFIGDEEHDGNSMP
ncbi:hypothetical protein BC832DRAFT_558187 [Gaertneriomyces semiglobifer]|nr:hypothetical protein BC832DRAFT_558187 [Gaertneriomyces semiglobifer]